MSKRPRITEQEKAYICKFYEMDGATSIAYALDRGKRVIIETYGRLSRQGKVNEYKQMWDNQFLETEQF